MSKQYLPDAGDIIWVHFNLPPGSTAQDHKPAVVISPATYNKKSGLIVACAITSTPKGYPFEVALAATSGHAALADQVKSLDWTRTKISHQGKINPVELTDIRAKLQALLLRNQ